MNNKLLHLAIFVAMLVDVSYVHASEKILGRWSDGWYVGTVVEKSNDKAKILFDDGDQATVPLSGIRPLDWVSGTRLQCNWKGAGAYYWATVVARSGGKISVRYDDKIEEATVIGRCRVPLNNVKTPEQQSGNSSKGNTQKTIPGCVDPYAGTGRDSGNCDPEVQKFYESMLQGVNPLTGENLCPSASQIADAKKTCAPADNYKECMSRLLGEYYDQFLCTVR